MNNDIYVYKCNVKYFKFKSNIPEKYKNKLEAMTLEQLEIVSEKIITSETLEEIFN